MGGGGDGGVGCKNCTIGNYRLVSSYRIGGGGHGVQKSYIWTDPYRLLILSERLLNNPPPHLYELLAISRFQLLLEMAYSSEVQKSFFKTEPDNS